ncbi:hypothetical protein FP2506_09566 [Fulvimarina pelagi HTCC2506]|uniref:Uncharacterized protein n=1 Tax=Fulvimarina pelagi HTCC2506 TaxID=314231 RepID=Q0G5I3_9HYPH|nr:hypothetical protein FP2506_09566 [Fulvimarina pelagi HTCC2506]
MSRLFYPELQDRRNTYAVSYRVVHKRVVLPEQQIATILNKAIVHNLTFR